MTLPRVNLPLAALVRTTNTAFVSLIRDRQRESVLLGVVLLHLLLFYAIILSLQPDNRAHRSSEMYLLLSPGGPRMVLGQPPHVALERPADALREPIIAVESRPPEHAIELPVAAGGAAVTVPAEAIGETHTVPPLSGQLMALARQATLRLRLLVGIDGEVSKAAVDISSGSTAIDALTIAWVTVHWRFKPALQDGEPVAVETVAVVPF